MRHQQHRSRIAWNPAQQLDQSDRARGIGSVLPLDSYTVRAAESARFERLLHPLGGARHDVLPFDTMLAYMLAHERRALAPACVEPAIEIAQAEVVPIGLGMAQQAEQLH